MENILSDAFDKDAAIKKLQLDLDCYKIQVQSSKGIMDKLVLQLNEKQMKVTSLEVSNAGLVKRLRRQEEEADELFAEKNKIEERFEEVIEEQDMLDQQIIQLTSQLKSTKVVADKAVALEQRLQEATKKLKRMERAQTIQAEHELTIKVGLQHLKDCLKKKLKFLGMIRCRKTASKIDVINKLLAHIERVMEMNR